jgi:thioesterase domain-containing protein
LALGQPGFVEGERLPATAAALLDVHVAALAQSGGDGPIVLLGHSAGGVIAHALAERLEQAGTPAAGVVLLDTYIPGNLGDDGDSGSELTRRVLAQGEQFSADWDDSWVIAMSRYFALDWWRPAEIGTRTLLLRAVDPMGERPADGGPELSISWRHSRSVTTVDVPGNHLTIIGEHAASTAEAIEAWLAEL